MIIVRTPKTYEHVVGNGATFTLLCILSQLGVLKDHASRITFDGILELIYFDEQHTKEDLEQDRI